MKKNPKKHRIASIEHESSYIRAYEDIELLNTPVMRPVRIELEVMKPELYLQKLNITQSIVCFGSARVRPEKEAKALVAQAKKDLAKNPRRAVPGSGVHRARPYLPGGGGAAGTVRPQ